VVWVVGKSECNGTLILAVVFAFFTLLSVLPLLFVHESSALRYVGNRSFFIYSAVSSRLVSKADNS